MSKYWYKLFVCSGFGELSIYYAFVENKKELYAIIGAIYSKSIDVERVDYKAVNGRDVDDRYNKICINNCGYLNTYK